MGINDRDYMRRPVSRSWWRNRTPGELIGIAMVAITVASSAVWLLRDISGLFRGIAEPPMQSLVVNINTATSAELQSLPGIGDARARLIIAHRPYDSVDDLAKVKSIGPSLVSDLRPFLKTDGTTERYRPAKRNN
jgi:competence protein ComEA